MNLKFDFRFYYFIHLCSTRISSFIVFFRRLRMAFVVSFYCFYLSLRSFFERSVIHLNPWFVFDCRIGVNYSWTFGTCKFVFFCLFLCMYYICMHFVCVHVCLCVCAYMRVCVYIRIHAHMLLVSVYVWVYVCVREFRFCLLIYTYIYIYRYIYI